MMSFLYSTDNQELLKNMSVFIRLLALALIFLGIRKIYYLSSDPKREKDFFPHIHDKRKPLDEAPRACLFRSLAEQSMMSVESIELQSMASYKYRIN
jgi:hypothetical protein